jgi:alanyl-tRNA synthetase
MGLERLVRVIQGKTSNYDTDIFIDNIHFIEKLVNKNINTATQKRILLFVY